jgi:hypothetical protein
VRGHHIASLSQDLRYLSLDCESSFQAIEELQKTKPSHFRSLVELHLSFESGDEQLDFEMPRTLTSLSLCNLRGSLSLPLSLLPSSLTHLHCSLRTLEILGSSFPPSLISLSLRLSELARLPSAFQQLPIGLEILRLDISTKFEGFLMEDWEALNRLQNLTSLSACQLGKLAATWFGSFMLELRKSVG